MADTRVKTAAPAYDGSTPAPRESHALRKVRTTDRKDPPAYAPRVWREDPPADIWQRICDLAAQPKNQTLIAFELGTSDRVLRRWLKEDPDLEYAFRVGRAKLENELASRIKEMGIEGEKPAVNLFMLGNRFCGWRRDIAEDQAAGNVNVTINLPASRPLADYIEGESEEVRQ